MGWFWFFLGLGLLILLATIAKEPNSLIPLAHAIFGH